MAPARMISFIENHASHCAICLADPDLQEEISRISEIVLPESKIPKAVRQHQEQTAEDESEDEEKGTEDTEEEGEEEEEEKEDEDEDEEEVFDNDDET
ncbi:MAG: hypothetical protein K0A99_06310 [Desulfoarculaceae bacterium]|nr:hypothetical protein [Desulfoarculaceae bacterium]